MVYDGINETDLSEVCVELTVWDRDRLASSLLGGLRLGAGTGTQFTKFSCSNRTFDVEVRTRETQKLKTATTRWCSYLFSVAIHVSAWYLQGVH